MKKNEKLLRARKYLNSSSNNPRPSKDPKFGALRLSVLAILQYLEEKEAEGQ